GRYVTTTPHPGESAPEAGLETTLAMRRHVRLAAAPRRRGRRRLRVLVVALIALLSPAVYSYTATMLQPSSLPLGVRSVEWLRTHHGNWLGDEDELISSGSKAPEEGGPQLRSLPAVGLGAHAAAAWPRAIKPVFTDPLVGEGAWKPTSPLVDGGPPVLVTTFRTELAYPRIVAYVAWFDHRRTALAFYPG